MNFQVFILAVYKSLTDVLPLTSAQAEELISFYQIEIAKGYKRIENNPFQSSKMRGLVIADIVQTILESERNFSRA